MDAATLLNTVFPLVLYGSLASAALWATWRERHLFWVGFWLAASFIVSNFLWAFGVPSAERPGIYTMLEVLISVATLCAWDARRRPALIALVAISALSVCANIAFSSIISPEWRQIHAWEVTTNLCFAAECLVALWVGVSHGFEFGRFVRRPFSNRLHPAPHAARSAKKEQP